MPEICCAVSWLDGVRHASSVGDSERYPLAELKTMLELLGIVEAGPVECESVGNRHELDGTTFRLRDRGLGFKGQDSFGVAIGEASTKRLLDLFYVGVGLCQWPQRGDERQVVVGEELLVGSVM